MNAFSRRGACPALAAPMRTGDGLLVRLNPVAGGLAPKSLIGLGEAASRYGNGIIEVTARGSLQIRGLTASSARLLAAEVDSLGIAVRTGVPVETGPLAGVDPTEIANPLALSERIRAGISETGLTSRLGPKVSVIVDGGGQLNMVLVMADVRLNAVRTDVGVRWRVSMAGDAEASTPLAIVAEDAACAAAIAILRATAEMGVEARTQDLTANQVEKLSSQFKSRHSALPKESIPSTGKLTCSSPLGILTLTDNACALGIGLPFGSMPAAKIIDIAHNAAAFGVAEIRMAPQRALLFLGPSPAAAARLQERAAALGFVADPADPRRFIAACPGAPACGSGRIATREIAERIALEDADLLDGSFMLHVSGCPKGCAHPGQSALTLVGGENGAGLVVDGTAKCPPAAYRPGGDAVLGIGRVATLIRGARGRSETGAASLHRVGPASVAEAYGRD